MINKINVKWDTVFQFAFIIFIAGTIYMDFQNSKKYDEKVLLQLQDIVEFQRKTRLLVRENTTDNLLQDKDLENLRSGQNDNFVRITKNDENDKEASESLAKIAIILERCITKLDMYERNKGA